MQPSPSLDLSSGVATTDGTPLDSNSDIDDLSHSGGELSNFDGGSTMDVEFIAPIGDERPNSAISVSTITLSTIAVEKVAAQLPVAVEIATTTNGPAKEAAMSYTNQAAATTTVTSGYVKKRESHEPPPCLVFNGGTFATEIAGVVGEMLQVLQGRIWSRMEKKERGVVGAGATATQLQFFEWGQDELGPTRPDLVEVLKAGAIMLGLAQFCPPINNKESCGIEGNGLYFKQWDPSGVSFFFFLCGRIIVIRNNCVEKKSV